MAINIDHTKFKIEKALYTTGNPYSPEGYRLYISTEGDDWLHEVCIILTSNKKDEYCKEIGLIEAWVIPEKS